MTEPNKPLIAAREAGGFPTGSDAARAMNISIATYNAHENGHRGLTLDAAKKYASFFGLPLDALIIDDDAETTKLPANNLRMIREQRSLTQEQLAQLVGCHWITISKLERSEMHLTHQWMVRLASPLGVKPFLLVADTETMSALTILSGVMHGSAS